MDLFGEPKSSPANPETVDRLMEAIGDALVRNVEKGKTSQADILSALFTILRNMLIAAKHLEDPKDHDSNAKEIGRVLMEFLVEFGSVGTIN